MKNRPFLERLGFAIAGLKHVWQHEHSFRTQAALAGVAAVTTAVLAPGWVWAALIVLSIALVLALELINSALEYLIDHVHPDIAPAIKQAKDAAAAAVLVISMGALAVGGMMMFAILTR